MGLSPVSFLLFLPFFFVDIGTFLNIEQVIALLHMSNYIAERWHRARGFCMCWAGEAPFCKEFNNNNTHTPNTIFSRHLPPFFVGTLQLPTSSAHIFLATSSFLTLSIAADAS